jgi:hypothetical protein
MVPTGEANCGVKRHSKATETANASSSRPRCSASGTREREIEALGMAGTDRAAMLGQQRAPRRNFTIGGAA